MPELSVAEKLAAANERAARVAALKVEYKKAYTNPFRTNHAIFDPAAMRYEAARAYSKDFYKYTPRSLWFPASLLVATVLLQVLINRERSEKEEKIATGVSTYYERAKFASRGLY
jgi:hypothetical protein